jgi:hypothetical protein
MRSGPSSQSNNKRKALWIQKKIQTSVKNKVAANRVAVSKVGANRAAANKVAANSVVVSKVEANRVAAVKNAAVNRVDDKADSWNNTSGGG